MEPNQEKTQVIVSGAGPVGLFLASELALNGISVTVLERLVEQDLAIKAGGINGRTTQMFARRGLARQLGEASAQSGEGFAAFAGARLGSMSGPTGGASVRTRFDGHFAGIFLHADPALPVPPSTVLSQQELEKLLMNHATELGVRVLRGCEVVDFHAEGETISVVVESRDGAFTVSGQYLVGCDGGRSTVRRLAGFEFPGTDPLTTGYQALVDLEDPDVLPIGWFATEVGLYAHGPTIGRLLTVCFDGPPKDRSAPITLSELQDNLRRVSGKGVTISKVHASTRYTDNIRQAATYRRGRVLLAGDAAHIHPPYGGQGLNTGLQDAANLGWKLAATLQGQAVAELLDTYTSERHPVAAHVLLNTRAQVALLRPDPLDRAMRELFAEELEAVPGLADSLVSMLQGLDIRYDLGGEEQSMVGRFMPDMAGLDEAMKSGGWVLALGADNPGPPNFVDRRYGVQTLRGVLPLEATAVLVRPDGYVAWATKSAAPNGDSLEEALSRWMIRQP